MRKSWHKNEKKLTTFRLWAYALGSLPQISLCFVRLRTVLPPVVSPLFFDAISRELDFIMSSLNNNNNLICISQARCWAGTGSATSSLTPGTSTSAFSSTTTMRASSPNSKEPDWSWCISSEKRPIPSNSHSPSGTWSWIFSSSIARYIWKEGNGRAWRGVAWRGVAWRGVVKDKDGLWRDADLNSRRGEQYWKTG